MTKRSFPYPIHGPLDLISPTKGGSGYKGGRIIFLAYDSLPADTYIVTYIQRKREKEFTSMGWVEPDRERIRLVPEK